MHTKKIMPKVKSKFNENPFHISIKDNLIEVWLGVPNDAESDYILTIDKLWLPELIAALKEAND